MGYGKEVYRKAIRLLAQRRSDAEAAAAQRVRVFYEACPRAQAIQGEKAAQGAQIAKAVLQGTDTRAALSKLQQENLALQREYEQLAQQHGFSLAALAPSYHCPDCSDTGFIDGRMCQCLKAEQKRIAYEALSMDVPLASCTFSGFSLSYYPPEHQRDMKKIFDFCKAYADGFSQNARSLLFRGPTGLGKTHLALAIAGAALEKGFGVIYGSAHHFAVTFEKERFERTDPEQHEDANARLRSCDLLILDDLGTEFSSSYVTAMLYDVINTRLLSRRPTIISTNLTLKELEKRYSERMASRIIGQYAIFQFAGKDIRIEKLLSGKAT